jgi:hypothetical protein
VAKVDAFEVGGLYLWFNSNDHLPPHFHAERAGEWEVRVFFLHPMDTMLEVVWPKKPSEWPKKAATKELLERSTQHRPQLLEEWQQKVNIGP